MTRAMSHCCRDCKGCCCCCCCCCCFCPRYCHHHHTNHHHDKMSCFGCCHRDALEGRGMEGARRRPRTRQLWRDKPAACSSASQRCQWSLTDPKRDDAGFDREAAWVVRRRCRGHCLRQRMPTAKRQRAAQQSVWELALMHAETLMMMRQSSQTTITVPAASVQHSGKLRLGPMRGRRTQRQAVRCGRMAAASHERMMQLITTMMMTTTIMQHGSAWQLQVRSLLGGGRHTQPEDDT